MVKNPPEMREIWVWSLGWEDPLEDNTASHSSILAWKIPWTEKPGGLQSTGSQRVRQDWSDLSHSYIFITVVLFLNLPNPMLYVTSFCKTCILNHIEKWKSNTVLAFFFFAFTMMLIFLRWDQISSLGLISLCLWSKFS